MRSHRGVSTVRPRPAGWSSSRRRLEQASISHLGLFGDGGLRSGEAALDAEAANLFFQLVSARYERASVIVTSNKPFGRWGEVFGDPVVAAAMIDRLVHHVEVVNLKGDSYRLKGRDMGRMTTNEEN